MFKFDGISQYCNSFFQVFYAIFRDFLGLGILGFSEILRFFQRFFGIFDEVYEDFQSNLPLARNNVPNVPDHGDRQSRLFSDQIKIWPIRSICPHS